MLHTPPRRPYVQRRWHMMPLEHNAQVIGQEAFHVADLLRELLTTAATPHHVLVCNQYKGERYIRLALPWPCPPHTAVWVTHLVRSVGWAPHTVRIGRLFQVFTLYRAVPPILSRHWQISTDAQTPPTVARFPATCLHGRTLDASCPVCDEELPW